MEPAGFFFLMKDASICYIFPSRERPENFFATLRNISLLSMKDDFQILAVLDLDDPSMNNGAVKKRISQHQKVTAYYGVSTGKVSAINREVSHIPKDTDIIILMSDDQKFIMEGYDEIIRVDMQKYFPDLDGALHYDDGTPASDNLCTMIICGYKYFLRFGYLYHPDYISVFCDNHYTQTAKILGKYKFIASPRIYDHNHFIWNKAPIDALYIRNEDKAIYHKDKETFLRHQANNFGI